MVFICLLSLQIYPLGFHILDLSHILILFSIGLINFIERKKLFNSRVQRVPFLFIFFRVELVLFSFLHGLEALVLFYSGHPPKSSNPSFQSSNPNAFFGRDGQKDHTQAGPCCGHFGIHSKIPRTLVLEV